MSSDEEDEAVESLQSSDTDSDDGHADSDNSSQIDANDNLEGLVAQDDSQEAEDEESAVGSVLLGNKTVLHMHMLCMLTISSLLVRLYFIQM